MKHYFCTFLLVCHSLFVMGQSWTPVAEESILQIGLRDIQPDRFSLYVTDDEKIKEILWSAPAEGEMEVQKSPARIQVALPDGIIQEFTMLRYEMMEPELSARYPEIRTFYGVAVSDPSMHIRVDYSHQGFRAVIAGGGHDKVFVDHYQRGDKRTRIVYYKKDYQRVPSWGCHTEGEPVPVTRGANGNRIGDCQLRSYRLAQATTGEYSNYHGATSSSQSALVMAAVTTVINRINEVYEAEVAVRLILVANTDLVFYYNANTDPYTNNNGGTMLGQNITTINNIIGSANYDIGHVFSTGGGGVAYLGSVCGSNKAGGVTGSSVPVGDPFTIDYVAHEMGHQFNAPHTFAGNSGSCSGNASWTNSGEPGSGTSIMAYAGICTGYNVQNNSDAIFHARSLESIKTFVNTGSSCEQFINTFVNTQPAITAQSNYFVPILTPFALTLAATDPENHPMTYVWDVMNVTTSANPVNQPSATMTAGPSFRHKLATTSATRYFPPLANVINNTTNTWEVLPSVARTLNFRGIARDFTGVAGCNNEINLNVTTVAGNGSFSITSFNTATSWAVGDTRTITWSVAGTNTGSINCANVDIRLSYDGGNTYPVSLASAVPNDGSHDIVVPSGTTTTGRIMVRGTNHIFFDINNANISITQPTASFTMTASPNSHSVCPAQNISSTVTINPVGTFASNVTLTVSGLPSGATGQFSVNPVPYNATSTFTATGLTTPGVYTLIVTGVSGALSSTASIALEVKSVAGTANMPVPANNATNISLTPLLDWDAVSGALSYDMQLAYDAAFTDKLVDINSTNTSYQVSTQLYGGTTFYWRVRATNNCGTGSWNTQSFTVEPCYFYTSVDVPVLQDIGQNNSVFSKYESTDRGTVTDINVLDLNGVFTGIGSLDFILLSPAGQQVLFWDSPCSRENEYDIQFDDAATLSIWPCPPTTGLSYIPSNPLSGQNGQSLKGNWRLRIDRNTFDDGQLNGWGLKACANNICRLTVDHLRNSGPGSLVQAISCSLPGDTIRFAESLQNDTFLLGNVSLAINKALTILANPVKDLHIISTSASSTISCTAPVGSSGLVIKGMRIHGSASAPAAITNSGRLTLDDCVLYSTSGSATMLNQAGAVTDINGNCQVIDN